jgi:selenocysteine-specific elongation factor
MSEDAARSTEERYLVLGTAGHIDHGKTTLVKALTGTDCDRLVEEKQRGITIELGFAHWRLPDGTTLGIIDVPGHKRFVRNMVAGAFGIDLVMLVVAADDGVMPQTREHLQIARLLGVQAGLVALTKVDLVDDDVRELAAAEVEELLEGTVLAGCPIIPVSGSTGAGLEELSNAAMAVASGVSQRAAGAHFRMPIDRVFTIKGVGTVVTGTTVSGTISVDSELEVVPGGKTARVRNIEVHGEQRKMLTAGRRAALNLVGLDRKDVNRGDVLALPGSLPVTFMFDAEVELLAEVVRPLRRGSEALLHCGAAELSAKLFPLDADFISAGAPVMVQLRLKQELPVAPGDRFILRDSTSEYTIGGGRVLDAHPTKHRRKRQDAATRLSGLRGDDPLSALMHEVEKSQFTITAKAAALHIQLGLAQVTALTGSDAAKDAGLAAHAVGAMQVLTAPANRKRIAAAVLKALAAYRAANPLAIQGLSAKALSKAVDRGGPGVPVEVLAPVLADAAASGTVIEAGGTFAIPREEVKLGARYQQALEIILDALNASAQPTQPGKLTGLPVDGKRLKQLLTYLEDRGEIASHSAMYFGMAVIKRIERSLVSHFKREELLSVSGFGKLAGSSRKYSVPLLNYFEQQGMLKRQGNDRVLNEGWQSGDY